MAADDIPPDVLNLLRGGGDTAATGATPPDAGGLPPDVMRQLRSAQTFGQAAQMAAPGVQQFMQSPWQSKLAQIAGARTPQEIAWARQHPFQAALGASSTGDPLKSVFKNLGPEASRQLEQYILPPTQNLVASGLAPVERFGANLLGVNENVAPGSQPPVSQFIAKSLVPSTTSGLMENLALMATLGPEALEATPGLTGLLKRAALPGVVRGATQAQTGEGTFGQGLGTGFAESILPEALGGITHGMGAVSGELATRRWMQGPMQSGDMTRLAGLVGDTMPSLRGLLGDNQADWMREFVRGGANTKAEAALQQTINGINLSTDLAGYPIKLRVPQRIFNRDPLMKGYNPFGVPDTTPFSPLDKTWEFNKVQKFLSDMWNRGFNPDGSLRTNVSADFDRGVYFKAKNQTVAQLNAFRSGLGDEFDNALKQRDAARVMTNIFNKDAFTPEGQFNRQALIDRIDHFSHELGQATGKPDIAEDWINALRGRGPDVPGGMSWQRPGPIARHIPIIKHIGYPSFRLASAAGPAGFEGFAGPTGLQSLDRMYRSYGRPLGYMMANDWYENVGKNLPAGAPEAGPALSETHERLVEKAAPTASATGRAQEIASNLTNPSEKAIDISNSLRHGLVSLNEVSDLLRGANAKNMDELTAKLPLPDLVSVAEIGDPAEKRMMLPIILQRARTELPKLIGKDGKPNLTWQHSLARRIAVLQSSGTD